MLQSFFPHNNPKRHVELVSLFASSQKGLCKLSKVIELGRGWNMNLHGLILEP